MREAREALSFAMKVRSNAFAIHYACESFDQTHPRVFAIAARNLGTAATESFSIDKTAASLGVDLATATPSAIDRVERKMLDGFFAFVGRHQGHHWLHWNMRDAKFGFDAIEDRHRALKGKPAHIPAAQRFDLSSRLFDLYGDRHAPKASRLQFIAAKNAITLTDFLDGPELGAAVSKRDHARVLRSTLRKADILYEIADKAERAKLKTNAKTLDPYGGWGGALHYLRDHPLYLVVVIGIIPFLTLVLRARDVLAWLRGTH